MTHGALWPVANPAECRLFLAALKSRIALRVFVPNKDRDGQTLHQRLWIARLQGTFTHLCGGQTTFLSVTSHFATVGGSRMAERSASVETYLPVVVTDAFRRRVLDVIIGFGQSANQEVVLVAVGMLGYRIQLRQTEPNEREASDVASRSALA